MQLSSERKYGNRAAGRCIDSKNYNCTSSARVQAKGRLGSTKGSRIQRKLQGPKNRKAVTCKKRSLETIPLIVRNADGAATQRAKASIQDSGNMHRLQKIATLQAAVVFRPKKELDRRREVEFGARCKVPGPHGKSKTAKSRLREPSFLEYLKAI